MNVMDRLPQAGHDETPDGELVRRVCDGDEAALSVLYRRYVRPIYRFILAQVRSQQDAEDLTSETFARMMRALDGFRGDASFKSWLFQIARNAVRNHRRAAGYRRTVPLDQVRLTSDPIDATRDERAAHERVLRLLRPLPPRYRRVLELRFLVGLSVRQTAERMGITVTNAKVLQHRALRKAAAMEAQRLETE